MQVVVLFAKVSLQVSELFVQRGIQGFYCTGTFNLWHFFVVVVVVVVVRKTKQRSLFQQRYITKSHKGPRQLLSKNKCCQKCDKYNCF